MARDNQRRPTGSGDSASGRRGSGQSRSGGAPRSGVGDRARRRDGDASRARSESRGGNRGGEGRGRLSQDRGRRDPDAGRDERSPGLVRPESPDAPDIPDEVTFDQLDKSVRARLRTLSKDNAEDVGRHLVMAGRLLDIDPELAYRHAQVAAARGGRVDVVREAAAIAAYATGRYAEALREFRTVRRLSGSHEHLPLMADCERGLGRPERAIDLSREPDAKSLGEEGRIELALVVAGARLDMGEADAALLVLNRLDTGMDQTRARIDEAKIDVLRALDRHAEADALEAALPPAEQPEETWADEVLLYDTEELPPAATEEFPPAADAQEPQDGGEPR